MWFKCPRGEGGMEGGGRKTKVTFLSLFCLHGYSRSREIKWSWAVTSPLLSVMKQ